jgi:Cu-processing system ATP-binding protein
MIRYRALTKTFGVQRAVADLTLDVGRGEVLALLGPNGSGKTTTLKAAAGLIRPTSGEVLLGEPGLPASAPEARRAISYLPQRVSFPDALTGQEVVEFYRALRGVRAGRTHDVLHFASLNGAGNRNVGTYSGGMVQRLGLAVAMLAEAPILLLDEPTAALDPDGLVAFYDLVDRRKHEDGTVFFTSHQLGDAERLADRFAILVEGKLVAVLSQAELHDRLSERGVMRLKLGSVPPTLHARVSALVPDADWQDQDLVIPGAAASRPAIIEVVRAAGVEILGLTTEEGRLDSFYRELVGEQQ